MNQELGNKVDETRESINGLRQGNSALSDSLKALAEVAAVKSGIRLLSDSVNMVHRAVHTNGHRVGLLGKTSWAFVPGRKQSWTRTQQQRF